MTLSSPSQCDLQAKHSAHNNDNEPLPESVSDLSAPHSDVEPETTATAARVQSKGGASCKTKRSYNTVSPSKRDQLIHMVNTEQKTIKEAANRLRINYSTAKHIIKSKKTELPIKEASPTAAAAAETMIAPGFSLPAKHPPSVDI